MQRVLLELNLSESFLVIRSFELVVITSNSDKGQAISDLYPALIGYSDLVFFFT